ncbi:MAG: hypothetical protein EBQ99_11290, partial [Planctomycetes bacterium]|nr:hypothetical protein [Planctomycetota bacterium]
FVDKGTIELQDEAIVLPKRAWEFTTAGGGSGSIHGRIRIPRVGKGRDALPELNLWVSNDRINPLLLAAIPVESWERDGPAPDGWPGTRMSTASTCMAALQMTGTVGIMGTIGSAQDGSTTLNLELGLANGAFRPRNGPDRLLERSGLPWPAGFDVTDVEATALLTDKLATLVKLTGKAGDGSVTATGTASLQTRDRELVAKLRNAPLGLWLTPMLPAGVRDAATATWQRCQAAGTFDGDLTVHQDATGADRRHASFQCRGIRFVADGQPCELRAPLGHIVIDGPTLRLDGLELEAIGDGRLLGSMQVDGDIALEHGASQALAGCWNIAEIAGPFWPTVLQAANLDDIARLHRRWNAGGSA